MSDGFSETLKSLDSMLDAIQDYYEESGDLNMHEIERIIIQHSLKLNTGNRTKTAKMLNLSIRTIRNKLNEYGQSEI